MMKIDESVHILEILGDGINPDTGEVFPLESPYNHPVIIRALFSVIQHYKNPPKKIKKTLKQKQSENLVDFKGFPLNAGFPWTEEDRNKLAQDFTSGNKLPELVEKYQRTNNSLTSELKRQGLIKDERYRLIKG